MKVRIVGTLVFVLMSFSASAAWAFADCNAICLPGINGGGGVEPDAANDNNYKDCTAGGVDQICWVFIRGVTCAAGTGGEEVCGKPTATCADNFGGPECLKGTCGVEYRGAGGCKDEYSKPIGTPYDACNGTSDGVCQAQDYQYMRCSCNGTSTCDCVLDPDGKDGIPGNGDDKITILDCSSEVSCLDLDDCTNDTCSAGVCESTPAMDGDACDDGNDCTIDDTCYSGGCEAKLCSTNAQCSSGECKSGQCQIVCDDGDACTDDLCLIAGGTCNFIDNGTCMCDFGIPETAAVYPEPMYPGTVGVGICAFGEDTCVNPGTWMNTTPPITPGDEFPPGEYLTSALSAACDSIDDDCDSDPTWQTDCYSIDATGLVFNATTRCETGVAQCNVTLTACLGEVLPQMEVCDGFDSDCDGIVDNVPPGMEVCDGIDNDCNGIVDDGAANASCGANRSCHWGACYDDCATAAECGGGLACLTNDGRCQALPDTCSGVICPATDTCVQGSCFPVCGSDAECDPTNERCYQSGVCRNDPDPCVDAQCPQTQVCYGGACFDPCSTTAECMTPDICLDGRCAPTACTDVDCPLNEVCVGGTCFPTCVDDSYCGEPNQYCYAGRCATNNCEGITCEVGDACFGGTCFDVCTGTGDCGDVCWDTKNADDVCDGGPLCGSVVCGTSQTCVGGSCFDVCSDNGQCDPDEECFDSRCVDTGDPTCDRVVCPHEEVCVTGQCWSECDTDAECSGSTYCYQGGCVDPECSGVVCPDGEACFEGVCFESCDDANPCVAPDGCFDGRCAPTACEAMADTYIDAYIADHPFTDSDKRVVAEQGSTPWFYAHPVEEGEDYDDWIGQSANQSNAYSTLADGSIEPINKAKTGRVVLYLDDDTDDYVLYLTHGAQSGQGEADAVYSIVTVGTNPNVLAMDDPGLEGVKVTDSNPRHITAFVSTGANETGGIAIGHLRSDKDWSVEITSTFHGDITAWEFYDGVNDVVVPLKLEEKLTLASMDFNSGEKMWPSHGSLCLTDQEGVCGLGTYLGCTAATMECIQTIYPSVERCDGLDNSCNGSVDELDANLKFPMVYWQEGGLTGWQLLATYDQDKPVGDILNYTPSASDDRVGSTNVILPDGTAIQEKVDQANVFAYRNTTTGRLYMGYFFGKDSDIAAYDPDGDSLMDTYTQSDIDLDLEEFDNKDLGHVYVAWYDDRRPGPTLDKVVDRYRRGLEEFDARFENEIRDGRTESDGWILGTNWTGGTERMSFFFKDREVADWSNSRYVGNVRLHRPANTPASLPGMAHHFYDSPNYIYVRIVETEPEDSVCESLNVTPAGCQLSRYTCSAGKTVCQAAQDPACNTCFDLDNDGVPGYDPTSCPMGNDCDDEDPFRAPGQPEICDGLDNDCDGEIDITVQPDGSRQGTLTCGGAITCTCPEGPMTAMAPANQEPCYCGESLSE